MCFIDGKVTKEDDMKRNMSSNLEECIWYDCLGRRVRLRLSTLDEVALLVQQNMQDQPANNG